MKQFIAVFLCLTIALFISGCQVNKTMGGAGIGAIAGGTIGGLTKGSRGALIGAGLGAAAGGLIGHTWEESLKKQEAELRQQLPNDTVEITRSGEASEELILSFKADAMFASGRYDLLPGAFTEVERVAGVLNKYPESIIIVRGHTDSIGSDESNQVLSERRAEAVSNVLIVRGVGAERIMTIGYGKTEPVAPNNTEAGRQANRRVEVQIANLETYAQQ